MRGNFLYSVFILVFALIGVLIYLSIYNTENDRPSIESELQFVLNEQDLTLLDIVRLDKTSSYIALFTLKNGEIGYAQLVQGFNNKLRCKRAGYGTNEFSYQKIVTNKGEYGIVIGKNPDLKINHITVTFLHENYVFTSYIKNKKYFVLYEKLPSRIQRAYPVKLTFYDKNNNVINNG